MTRAGEKVDPHHAIRAGGITFAVVRCDASCPPEHGYRADRPAATEPNEHDESGRPPSSSHDPVGPDTPTDQKA